MGLMLDGLWSVIALPNELSIFLGIYPRIAKLNLVCNCGYAGHIWTYDVYNHELTYHVVGGYEPRHES